MRGVGWGWRAGPHILCQTLDPHKVTAFQTRLGRGGGERKGSRSGAWKSRLSGPLSSHLRDEGVEGVWPAGNSAIPTTSHLPWTAPHPLPRVCGDWTEWRGGVSMPPSGFIFPEQDVFTCVCSCEYTCVHTHRGTKK